MPPSKKTKRSSSENKEEAKSRSADLSTDSDEKLQYFSLAEGIVSIPKLLSKADCEEQIRKSYDYTFEESEVGNSSRKKNVGNKKVRNSEQVELNDEELSKKVFVKCEDAIKKMVGCLQTLYKKGQFFNSHIDSGRNIEGHPSFITVLIYLNDDFEGGETVFEDEDVTIEPELGKCVLFLHQIKHTAEEITKNTKFVIKSAVLFEENENYEKQLAEKFFSGESNKTKLEGSVIVQVGDEAFNMSVENIGNFTDSMLYTLINTEMASDVEINKDGIRVFKFPSQDPHIFKRFILPIFNQADHLDFPFNFDPSEEEKIDSEFKYWGLLSPFDKNSISNEIKYSNKQEPWKSAELSLISKPLEFNLEKQKNELEAKLAILKAIKEVKEKLKFDFSYKKKYKSTFEMISAVKENLENKYEVIILNHFYDENFFLLGSDKELFETCLALFGGPEFVSVSNLKFVMESRDSEQNASSVIISDQSDITSKSKYDFEMHNMASNLIDEKNIKDPNELEEELDLCGLKVKGIDLTTKASKEKSWEGEYNDEYYPSYSLFKLTGILINVKRLQE
ncbi:hypothetical protein NAEGRDRAFT_78740 [Naegleria gruberi]|uniref:Fe2OG dioxygenase domain-containing protein n=1 Tax=Naegleria gruberi TaxID=5762 RepID=D2V646_NAEGR|nr:uncharacterized protein NAEGRDRAFT_78740 [Naegleria gruberi]EFC47767.1 hypothetical protein NAEGRDRAFT_78740 [Naegleria gruberi]|eukprot:XP_002680511.1 hypothetical protein NAEGRDRAFT_78740 [Naegleria gruberi strain NEG-M]